jgi:N4-gp56 family major capsid protein
MADTPVASGLTVQQWDDQFFTEYLTENRFAREMGTDENAIIQVKEDLTKKKGDSVTFALVNKLTNAATTGSDTLEGNEEKMDTRSFRVEVDKRRNGVRVAEMDEQASAIALRAAGKAVLKEWSVKDTESLIIGALASINGTAYGAASEAAKDAWLADNADRVLFGAARSNNAGNDHSASLANCDTTNDLLTPDAISQMKLIATTIANPKIRPIRIEETAGRRYFTLYAHPLAFRDLKKNAAIVQAQREVMLEMENNRLFQGGDLYWDGVIVKEITDMYDTLTLAGVGNGGSTTVVPAFLVGAQAVGVAYAKRWKSAEQTFDYGDKRGVAIESIYGVQKMKFGSGAADTDDPKDHGVVTGYFASSTTS